MIRRATTALIGGHSPRAATARPATAANSTTCTDRASTGSSRPGRLPSARTAEGGVAEATARRAGHEVVVGATLLGRTTSMLQFAVAVAMLAARAWRRPSWRPAVLLLAALLPHYCAPFAQVPAGLARTGGRGPRSSGSYKLVGNSRCFFLIAPRFHVKRRALAPVARPHCAPAPRGTPGPSRPLRRAHGGLRKAVSPDQGRGAGRFPASRVAEAWRPSRPVGRE